MSAYDDSPIAPLVAGPHSLTPSQHLLLEGSYSNGHAKFGAPNWGVSVEWPCWDATPADSLVAGDLLEAQGYTTSARPLGAPR